jgi:hypothetical protein
MILTNQDVPDQEMQDQEMLDQEIQMTTQTKISPPHGLESIEDAIGNMEDSSDSKKISPPHGLESIEDAIGNMEDSSDSQIRENFLPLTQVSRRSNQEDCEC